MMAQYITLYNLSSKNFNHIAINQVFHIYINLSFHFLLFYFFIINKDMNILNLY